MKWYIIFIQFAVTCFFFFIEALFHFNIGKSNGELDIDNIILPDRKETFLLCSSIALCAALSSIVSGVIERYLVEKDKTD